MKLVLRGALQITAQRDCGNCLFWSFAKTPCVLYPPLQIFVILLFPATTANFCYSSIPGECSVQCAAKVSFGRPYSTSASANSYDGDGSAG